MRDVFPLVAGKANLVGWGDPQRERWGSFHNSIWFTPPPRLFCNNVACVLVSLCQISPFHEDRSDIGLGPPQQPYLDKMVTFAATGVRTLTSFQGMQFNPQQILGLEKCSEGNHTEGLRRSKFPPEDLLLPLHSLSTLLL